MIYRLTCALIVFVSAYAFGVSQRNYVQVSDEIGTAFSALENARAWAATVPTAGVAEAQLRVAHLESALRTHRQIQFHWRMLRLGAGGLGLFGFGALFWILTRGRVSSTSAEGLA